MWAGVWCSRGPDTLPVNPSVLASPLPPALPATCLLRLKLLRLLTPLLILRPCETTLSCTEAPSCIFWAFLSTRSFLSMTTGSFLVSFHLPHICFIPAPTGNSLSLLLTVLGFLSLCCHWASEGRKVGKTKLFARLTGWS